MRDTTLRELAEVNPQTTLPSDLTPDAEVSFIPMGDISETGVWREARTRPLQEVSNGFTVFREGDVLLAKITPCLENGKGTHAVGLTHGIGFGSTEFHVLRARDSASPRYLYHVCQSRDLRLTAENFMIGSAGQQRVQREFFDHYRLVKLPYAEQQLIAHILDTLYTQIRRTEALIAKLEQMKQGLLTDLLTRGIDENGELRPPPEEAPHLYTDSPLGLIPQRWETASLGAAAEITAGTTPARSAPRFWSGGTTPWVRTGEVNFSVIFDTEEKVTETAVQEAPLRIFPRGTILIAMYGQGVTRGRCAVLGVEATTNQACAAVLPDEQRLSKRYLFQYLRAAYARLRNAGQGSNQTNLSGKLLASFTIALPSLGEQEMIASVLDALDDRSDTESKALNKLRNQKAALMDDLLTGRVRVTPLLEEAEQAAG